MHSGQAPGLRYQEHTTQQEPDFTDQTFKFFHKTLLLNFCSRPASPFRKSLCRTGLVAPFIVPFTATFLVAVICAGWCPMFRVLLDHLRVMSRRSVMEIKFHRRRGKQHVNRDTWWRRPRYPRTA